MSQERPSLVTVGSTVAAAERIIAWLKPELQGDAPDQVRLVERHIGQFNTPEEVKRHLSDRDGSIRVAALRVRDIHHEMGGVIGLVTWAAYVMATDSWGYGRDLRAEVMAGKLARRLAAKEAVKGMGAERKAADISADNIYSGNLDALGVTMWVVVWNQEFKLDEEVDISTLPDFLTLGMTATPRGGVPVIEGVISVREQDDEDKNS
ncbi:hypothetical protein GST45_17745 [Serratia marcescens]|uniref:DUF1834 family protein n=1 Tax=Serratia marcescens TaxID=615 RepID=A0ABD5BHU4_SERMA|nr:hypothetical protein [Serratia marcescens]MCZ6928681.1 hypothetical protein [Serratia marcescens]MDE5234334.1 hypothetical protein [Serratia marcescens]MDE5257499.1 hypothetical protein [Serratia marcescens]MDQ9402289.1 hypothetical protein [Serratia marcescens]MDQ9424660.1 hypothetical protein [Serratia marcescens]